MAEHTVTWSSIPFEQYWASTEAGRRQVEQRIRDIRLDPMMDEPDSDDPATDLWTVEYGGGLGLWCTPPFTSGDASSSFVSSPGRDLTDDASAGPEGWLLNSRVLTLVGLGVAPLAGRGRER